MYLIYCDGNLMQDFDVEGLYVVNPVLNLEINKAGTFEFDIYSDHPYYNFIYRLKSIVTVKYKDRTVFRGRVINDKCGIFKQKHIFCEGELAFLNDSIQRPYDFYSGDKHTTVSELFNFFIDNHNNYVDEKRQFKVGNVTVSDENDYIVRKDTRYPNTLTSINEKLIDSFGGYLRVRHESDGNYIDYIDDFNTLNQQQVEGGKNLMDITIYVNCDGFATAVIPLGAKLSEEEDAARLTIESVNDGMDYVYNTDAVEEYGLITTTVVHDGVTEPSNLMRKGEQDLESVCKFPETVIVTAADLAGTGIDINPFMFESYTSVVFLPLNVNSKMLTSEMTIELNNPGGNMMTLGKAHESLTDTTSGMQTTNKNIVERVEKVESNAKINEGAIEDLREDTNSTIIALREEVGSQITQSAESVKSSVYDNVYVKDEVDTLVSSVSTEVEQTKDSWQVIFNQFQADVNDIANGNDAKFEEIKKYIRFEDGNILLGNSESPLVLKIQNDRISFLQNGYEVAYISDRKMYNTVCSVIDRLEIGDSAWQVEYNEDGDTVVSLVEV